MRRRDPIHRFAAVWFLALTLGAMACAIFAFALMRSSATPSFKNSQTMETPDARIAILS